VLARTRDPATGRSVLADRQTTCLPKYMERLAYLTTAWRLGRYYRTYLFGRRFTALLRSATQPGR
jgi:hypothetical protein